MTCSNTGWARFVGGGGNRRNGERGVGVVGGGGCREAGLRTVCSIRMLVNSSITGN